jgi:hypothetical protein
MGCIPSAPYYDRSHRRRRRPLRNTRRPRIRIASTPGGRETPQRSVRARERPAAGDASGARDARTNLGMSFDFVARRVCPLAPGHCAHLRSAHAAPPAHNNGNASSRRDPGRESKGRRHVPPLSGLAARSGPSPMRNQRAAQSRALAPPRSRRRTKDRESQRGELPDGWPVD